MKTRNTHFKKTDRRLQDRYWLSAQDSSQSDQTTETVSHKNKSTYQTKRLMKCRQEASLIWISNCEGSLPRLSSSSNIKVMKVKTSVWNGRVKDSQGVLTSDNWAYMNQVPLKRKGHVLVWQSLSKRSDRSSQEVLSHHSKLMERSGEKKLVMVRLGRDWRDHTLWNKISQLKDHRHPVHQNRSSQAGAVLVNTLMKLRAVLNMRVNQLKDQEKTAQ